MMKNEKKIPYRGKGSPSLGFFSPPSRVLASFRLLVVLTGVLGGIAPVSLRALEQKEDFWVSFFAIPGQEPRIPLDTGLGVLMDRSLPPPSYLGIVEDFLGSLAQGEILHDALDPDLSLPLVLSLEASLEEKPDINSWRFGDPQREGIDLALPLRLTGTRKLGEPAAATTIGYLYLRRGEENWLIEDLGIDLTPLYTQDPAEEASLPEEILPPEDSSEGSSLQEEDPLVSESPPEEE